MKKLIFSKKDAPLGAYLTSKCCGVDFTWGLETSLLLDDSASLGNSQAISRHLARLHPDKQLYPMHILQRTEVDHWLTAASMICNEEDITDVAVSLDAALATSHCLVGDSTTIADYEILGALMHNEVWQTTMDMNCAPHHLLRWYNATLKALTPVMADLPNDVYGIPDVVYCRPVPYVPEPIELVLSKTGKTARKVEGRFVELPNAKEGEVVVRFPPEASGYLHIGHAKAALLNQHYQLLFKGKLVMRFDDTNPAKEDEHFEQVILEDLKLLNIKPDRFTHTSDYFDLMIEKCEQLIKDGLAYVDDTEPEQMKAERDEFKESKNRDNALDTNISMWQDMKKGTDYGFKCCVRAKIDMKSCNGCMRDPTIYRCKAESHVKTGDKYKVYPTYDFACPIVDSIEGVTHALRTTEYHDRDVQFEWFINAMNMRPVHIYEYSRLNMNNTVLSKRKLTWFVNEGLVDGWDDPRFPTVKGIMRRGMTVEGLKEFIIAQGSSRSVVNMEWDKIWAFNKKVINEIAPRYTALDGSLLIPVFIEDAQETATIADKHPKNESLGQKTVYIGPKVFIESVDADLLKVGENATFINWGNLMIKEVSRDPKTSNILSVSASPNTEDKNYRNTVKLTWLVDSKKAPLTPIICVDFDHLITKGVLGKDEDFKNFINKDNRFETCMTGDDDLKKLKKGDIIQIQRKGFYIVDEEYKVPNSSTCVASPVVMFYIPDGKVKSTGISIISTKSKAEISKSSKLVENKSKPAAKSESSSSSVAADLNDKVKCQGEKIRDLKSKKADKATVTAEVAILLKLKQEFKDATGMDWKPDMVLEAPKDCVKAASSSSSVGADLNDKVKCQGEKIRDLKSKKADKATVTAEVAILLKLKQEFKDATGMDWKPDMVLEAPKDCVKATSSSSSVGADLNNKVKCQGEKIRDLKSKKADKATVTAEVAILLKLKQEFKDATGMDWKPDMVLEAPKDCVKATESSSNSAATDLNNKVKCQGEKVRELKSKKADKATVTAEVAILLKFKQEFKDATGMDWKPDMVLEAPKKGVEATASNSNSVSNDLSNSIKVQGDLIRKLKSEKAEKSAITDQVNALLALKKQFKDATGQEWKPDVVVSGKSVSKPVADKSPQIKSSDNVCGELNSEIMSQGDKIRKMKSNGTDKSVIKKEVDALLKLKDQFKEKSGSDWKPNMVITESLSVEKSKSKSKSVEKEESKGEDGKKVTRLGLEVSKAENLSKWYSQVITKSGMIDYYNVSGCYILRPWSYEIWEIIKNFFDEKIKASGVQNCYFPIFVSKDVLEKEKSHIADFSPEVAWVTRSGNSEMAEPIAIRPTSETVMYPAVAEWIQSHRDLPMRLNQWNNVVRWEFKQPTPFLRTREFLWQEGHSAFQTKVEATDEVYEILEYYASVYEELLAVPVVRGKKTEKEKFAGGDFTTTTEAFVAANGRAIQGATSHHLGQNFSKMFDITFEDPTTKEKQFVYQNSWGITTRTIGVMVMVHGDDKGLVLPPKVAKIQAIIMPVGITAKVTEQEKQSLHNSCDEIVSDLKKAGVRADSDYRDHVTPAWKFNHWELKGVPLRLEVGPREVKSGQVFVVRRDTGEKKSVARCDIDSAIKELLITIQQDMYNKAKAELDEHKVLVHSWNDFCNSLEGGNLLLAPFCGVESCEDSIKRDSAREEVSEVGAPSMGAKSLCIPFEQPQVMPAGTKCIHTQCSKNASYYTLFGRSY